MVYFGEKRFKNAQPGVTSREKSRIVVPSFLLLALVLVILAQQWRKEEVGVPIRTEVGSAGVSSPVVPPAEQPPRGASTGDPSVTDPSVTGTRLQAPVEIPPFDTLVEPKPFEAMPGILSIVRDGEIADPGPPEVAGMIYLFHRWRAGVEVPVTEFDVEWDQLPFLAKGLRGRRTEKIFELVEEPIPRTLDENRAGVLRYWEAFAKDRDGHLVRLEFLEKPRILPAGTEVEATVDFLRLHQYQMVRGGSGVVPEWVGKEVRILEPLPFKSGDWSPLLWVMGISFGALALLLIIVMRNKEPAQRRRRERPKPGSRPASPDASSGAPTDPETS